MGYEISVTRGRWGSAFTIEPPISDEHAQLLGSYMSDDSRAGYQLEPDFYDHELPDLHDRIVKTVNTIHRALKKAGVEVKVVEDTRYEQRLLDEAREYNKFNQRRFLGIE